MLGRFLGVQLLQVIDNLEHSIPTALVRVLGLLAIALGLAFIYVGIYVV